MDEGNKSELKREMRMLHNDLIIIKERFEELKKMVREIVNGKAEDKSKIEVLKDLFPERHIPDF